MSAIIKTAITSYTRFTTKEVVLTSITANNAKITVGGNTNLKGALIAATDNQGNDTGNLSLTTNTLTHENMSSSTYSTESSLGGGVSLGQKHNDNKTTTGASSISYNASNGMSYSKEKTLATIGSGSLIIKESDSHSPEEGNLATQIAINHNTATLTKELYNGGVHSDVKAVLDTRLLSEEGLLHDKQYDLESEFR